MDTVVLGRTGLKVTSSGLGCGGFSRAGIRYGLEHASGIVRAAYDMGVTFFDTAAAYGSQPAVGHGLRGLKRDSYTLSTKFTYRGKDGDVISPEQMLASLHTSLRELETDCIDIFHIHALVASDFPRVRDSLLPELLRAKEQGKFRFLGLTERFGSDTGHDMLNLVIPEDLFDVVMVGYNILNPSAAKAVLPLAVKNNLGVLCMYAVRKALWDREQLKKDLLKIIDSGQGGAVLNERSLDFLMQEQIAQSLPEAAYRFCRHTPGIDVTLTGTGNREHLSENLRSLDMPKLPDWALERLRELFEHVDCVSGQ